MTKMITELSNALNIIKGFEAGYTSRNDEEFLVAYGGKIYTLSIEEVEETTDKLNYDHIKKYL